MKIKINPDRQKAESLKKMAEITLKRLEDTDKGKYPSNTLIDYYEAIHKLMEAVTIKEGVKIKGEGAHQQLIDYIAKKKYFDEQNRIFLQEMRDFRNRISYEGFMVNKNYITLNTEKIKKIINTLLSKVAEERNQREKKEKSPLIESKKTLKSNSKNQETGCKKSE